MSNKNKIIVPEARIALNQMKAEIANELGISSNDSIDKRNLTSRNNGNIGGALGGNMTKKLIELGEKNIID